MKSLSVFCFLALFSAQLCAQQTGVEQAFNEQTEHSLGFGLAITGFNSQFAYFVSPHYALRYHRHYLAFSPFYGNFSGIRKHHDVGFGLDYRLYPFKNLSEIVLYFPLGIHYNFKWSEESEKSALLYKVGFGAETLLGKHFALSLDANFGIGQYLGSKSSSTELGSFGSAQSLSYYFLPIIRVSYRL